MTTVFYENQALEIMTNTSSSPTQEDIDRITSTYFPPEWFKANPNYQNYVPFPKESVSPETVQKQYEAMSLFDIFLQRLSGRIGTRYVEIIEN